jgi:aspartate aminotransferase-like enzyme
MSATRKPGRNFLFVPGPTNIPDRILRAMHIAMEDHRSSDFPKLTLPLYERLKRIFKTKEGQVVIFPSSGTDAWEAVLTNTLAPGDTPALPMLHGLREALNIIDEEGLENVFARHHHLAKGARAAVKAWGLKLCAKEPKWHSDTVTAIMVPAGFNGADVIDVAYRRYNLALGAGLSQVAGKLFRIGHLGDLNELMLLGAIAGAEMAMRDTGIEVELGSGVAAAQAEFRDGMQAKIKQVAAE